MDCIGIEGQLELFNGSPVVVYTCEPDGDFATTFISPGVSALLGWEASDFLTDPSFWGSHIHPDDKGRVLSGISSLFENDHYSLEYRFRHKDGSYRWMSDMLQLERNESGEPVRIVGYWMDISAQKQAKQALSDSEIRYRQMAELSPDGIFVHVDDEIVFANAKLAQILETSSPADLFGTPAIELIAPEYRERIIRRRCEVMNGEITKLEQSEFLRSDGSRVAVEHSGGLISWEGSPAILVLVRDVSEREAAARALRESDERFRGVIENSPTSLSLKDPEGRFRLVNSRFTEWFGKRPEELIGKTVPDIWPKDHSDTVLALDRKVMETGRTHELDHDVLFADGTLHSVVVTKFPVLGSDNKIIGIGTINSDVTERVAAERAVVESRDQLRLITDNLPAWITYIDDQQHYRFVNKTCTEWLARPDEEIVGKTISEIMGQEYEKIGHRIEMTLAGEQQSYVNCITYRDGATRTIHVTNVPHWGPAGNIVGFFSLVEDISELQQAEEALRQAQKMEAVGQLTGGVAHDFNNLLAVILGNTELLENEIGDNPLLTTIDHAATRGAELTQRLLTFARQQALQPKSIDLRELIPGLDDLFRLTLSEQVKIAIHVPEGIWPVTADPGQLESALLNLAINARDAMPEGGVLEINCENVQVPDSDRVAAGDYVQIAVRDSGSGMRADVLEHVLEPFFTTKDVGEGSGLGLSIVYGFVRQSGGDATIESEPGTGTEVKLLLPRSEVTNMLNEPTQGEDMKCGQGHEEAILVLEDDPDVRSFAVAALEGLGYRVHEAADANAALQVLEEEADNLDLLLSDVVLPGGVSGPELAAKAKDLYPKLKLVFMSGYAADLYTHDKIPGFDEILLTKPFRLAELSKAVQATLAE